MNMQLFLSDMSVKLFDETLAVSKVPETVVALGNSFLLLLCLLVLTIVCKITLLTTNVLQNLK